MAAARIIRGESRGTGNQKLTPYVEDNLIPGGLYRRKAGAGHFPRSLLSGIMRRTSRKKDERSPGSEGVGAPRQACEKG